MFAAAMLSVALLNADGLKNQQAESAIRDQLISEYLEAKRDSDLQAANAALSELDRKTKEGRRQTAIIKKQIDQLKKGNYKPQVELEVGSVGYIKQTAWIEQILGEDMAVVTIGGFPNVGQVDAGPRVIARGNYGQMRKGSKILLAGFVRVSGTQSYYKENRQLSVTTDIVIEPVSEGWLREAIRELNGGQK